MAFHKSQNRNGYANVLNFYFCSCRRPLCRLSKASNTIATQRIATQRIGVRRNICLRPGCVGQQRQHRHGSNEGEAPEANERRSTLCFRDRNDLESGLASIIMHPTCRGSFSVISKPILATNICTKFSFCSIYFKIYTSCRLILQAQTSQIFCRLLSPDLQNYVEFALTYIGFRRDLHI